MATAIAMGAVGGPAAVAQAGEVHVEAVVSPGSEGQYVAFTAAPGERNRVTVRYRAPNTVRVQDTAGVVAGEGCTAESPTEGRARAQGRGREAPRAHEGPRVR